MKLSELKTLIEQYNREIGPAAGGPEFEVVARARTLLATGYDLEETLTQDAWRMLRTTFPSEAVDEETPISRFLAALKAQMPADDELDAAAGDRLVLQPLQFHPHLGELGDGYMGRLQGLLTSIEPLNWQTLGRPAVETEGNSGHVSLAELAGNYPRLLLTPFMNVDYAAEGRLYEQMRRDFERQQAAWARENRDRAANGGAPANDESEVICGMNAVRLEKFGFDGAFPEGFVCGITMDILTDPVRFRRDCALNDRGEWVPKPGKGDHVYERSAIEYWFTKSNLNPMTQEKMTPEDSVLVADVALKREIDTWVAETLEHLQKAKAIVLFDPAVSLQRHHEQFLAKINTKLEEAHQLALEAPPAAQP